MSLALSSPVQQLTILGGGGTQVVLHLPALPALEMAAISVCESTRLKNSTSSINPVNDCCKPPSAFWRTPIFVLTALFAGVPPLSKVPSCPEKTLEPVR